MKMSGNYLLDTNIVIALFKQDASVIEKLKMASQVYHSSVVIGELYYGAYHSTRKEENTERIEEYVNNTIILSCDEYTSKVYGQIKANLKKKGTPIPENDIWIAATAIQYDLILVSRDQHFDHINNLSLEGWT